MTFLTGLSVLTREIFEKQCPFLLRRSVYWMRRFALYFTPAIPTSHVRLQYSLLNSLRLRQNGPHFADDIFKCIFLNKNVWIPIKISLKFVPKGPINNIPALVQIMAWRRPGNRPLSEPMSVSLPTHICVTRPQWVNRYSTFGCVGRDTSGKNSACYQWAGPWLCNVQNWLSVSLLCLILSFLASKTVSIIVLAFSLFDKTMWGKTPQEKTLHGICLVSCVTASHGWPL